MSEFRRYALYFAPRPRSDLAKLGSGWLGHDPETGLECARPDLQGLPLGMVDTITAQAARYGFHGTLKAPFFLAKPNSFEALRDAVHRLAESMSPFEAPELVLGRLDGFFALYPKSKSPQLQIFAQACVEALDRFRAALGNEERARRLAAGLSERQQDLLERWGYPYVSEEFRFHLTLTSRLDDVAAELVGPVLARLAGPCLGQSLEVEDICIFAEPAAGERFRLVERIVLTGSGP